MSELSSKDIIYLSRFYNNPSGNGGDKRAAQMCEMLAPSDAEFVSLCQPPYTVPSDVMALLQNPTGLYRKVKSKLIKHWITYHRYNCWSEKFRNYVLHLHIQTRFFVEKLKRTSVRVLLIDDPVFLAPVVHYAKSKKIPLVAFCHNLETLSSEQVENRFQTEMLVYELGLLSKCDLVITISTEETFLLRNLGMNPIYLPYFPVREPAERFMAVRKRRQGRKKANFLLMGTVYNFPTLEGMKRVIAQIMHHNVLSHDKLIVAGYGTNALLDEFGDASIELRGEVTDGELDEILAETKGCIVYQDTGSGALTKIPELLIAGVPVIINSHAARSHHHLPGIFEFGSLEQLGEQMDMAAEHDQFPQVLSPPATGFLRERIVELSNAPRKGPVS